MANLEGSNPPIIPRRIQQDKHTPAEMAITDAMAAVEDAGCDVLLTEAVNLLAQAKAKVADFVDAAPHDSAIARSARVTELRNKCNREHECRLKNPIIQSTSSGLGDFTQIFCACGYVSSTTGKEEAAA